LMAPTSLLLTVIPGGPPVLVGGPPTIDLFQLMFKMALKGLGKLWKKAKGKIKPKAPDTKTPKLGDAQPKSKKICLSDPVDVASGAVVSSNVDFELPGPIPLVWERTYYSNIEVEGPLGYNWHHSYNMGLYDMGNGFYTLRLADGRELSLPHTALGEQFFSRAEQLTWQRDKTGYFVTDANKLIYRFQGPKNKEGFHMISSLEDKAGFSIQFLYDNDGHLSQIVDAADRKVYVENDALGRIIRLSTETEKEDVTLIQYTYDAKGNMVQTTDALGKSKHFEYDGHLMVKFSNQSGTSFYWQYEGHGDDSRCIHAWGDAGVLDYWFHYDMDQGKTSVRDSLGHNSEYHYDASKLIYKIIDANGGITHQHYNDYSEIAQVINPEGLVVKYKYNSFGKLVQYTNENEESTSFEYDSALNLVEVNSPGGMSIAMTYDACDRVLEKKSADGNVLQFVYEGKYLSKIIDPQDREFKFEYDVQHQLRRILFPQGLVQRWDYDRLGRTLRSTDVKGNTTQYG
ncbi:MAG TPA: DUF6531 domain-containing protein, partial [Cytophagales bacterium]|nr:DUF6531 domain-containing protein [Cytophagales bacterium]